MDGATTWEFAGAIKFTSCSEQHPKKQGRLVIQHELGKWSCSVVVDVSRKSIFYRKLTSKSVKLAKKSGTVCRFELNEDGIAILIYQLSPGKQEELCNLVKKIKSGTPPTPVKQLQFKPHQTGAAKHKETGSMIPFNRSFKKRDANSDTVSNGSAKKTVNDTVAYSYPKLSLSANKNSNSNKPLAQNQHRLSTTPPSVSKYTNMKGRSDERPEVGKENLKGDKVRHFLEQSQDKCGGFLKSPIKMYTNNKAKPLASSDVATPIKFYGKQTSSHFTPRNMTSPVIKRPGFLSDPVESKRSRVDSVGYSWLAKVTPTQDQKLTLQGFANLGNTCYMNAILQSLYGLESFAGDLLSLARRLNQNGGLPQTTLLCALVRLLNAHRKSSEPEQKRSLLANVKRAISTTAKRFSGFEQHDAHEFLSQVMDQLKEEVQKLSRGSSADSGGSSCEDSPEHPELVNPTVANFEFGVNHNIVCMDCGNSVMKDEQFHYLSLDIPRKRTEDQLGSLQDCLDRFFLTEFLEYICEGCKSKRSEVTHKFTHLPRVLVLQLKRYYFQASRAQLGKVGFGVRIPRFISLRGHCCEATVPPSFPPENYTPNVSKYSFKPSSCLLSTQGEKRNLSDDSDEDESLKKVLSTSLLEAEKIKREEEEENNRLKRVLEESARESKRPRLWQDDDDLCKQNAEIFLTDSQETGNTGTTGSTCSLSTTSNGENGYAHMSEEQMLKCAIDRSCQEAGPLTNGSPERLSTVTTATVSVDAGGDVAQTREEESMEYECLPQVDGTVDSPLGDRRATGAPTRLESTPNLSSPALGLLAPEESGSSYRQRTSSGLERPGSRKKLFSVVGKDTSPVGVLPKNSNFGPLVSTDGADKSTWFDQLVSDDELAEGEGLLEENKENETPEKDPARSEEWLEDPQKQEADDISRAIQNSMLDQNPQPRDEEEEVRLATELSLQTTTGSECWENLEEDIFLGDDRELHRSPEEEKRLILNEENGSMPYSYRLVSIVSHLGTSSSVGHYVSDVYDLATKTWHSFDDSKVSALLEKEVLQSRQRTGYVFFYVHKDILDDLISRPKNAHPPRPVSR